MSLAIDGETSLSAAPFHEHGLKCWLSFGQQASKRNYQARRARSPEHLTQHLSLFMFCCLELVAVPSPIHVAILVDQEVHASNISKHHTVFAPFIVIVGLVPIVWKRL